MTDPPAPLVTAVVVSFESATDLEELLPALAHPDVEVVVVDNASRDGSAAVAARSGHVTVLGLDRNTGWTAGCNTGARVARGRALAFVNPDARPSPEQLLALAGRLDGDVASVSPRFVDPDGRTSAFYFRRPTPLSGLLLFTTAGQRVDRALGSRVAGHRVYGGRPQVQAAVEQPGAACLVVDRVSFLADGGFDESMWLFFSDAEWCSRQVDRGLRHLVRWDVPVLHVGGGSVLKLPPLRTQRLFQRDYARYAVVRYSAAGRLVTFLGLLLLSVVVPAAAAAARGDLDRVRGRLVLVHDILAAARRRPAGPVEEGTR